MLELRSVIALNSGRRVSNAVSDVNDNPARVIMFIFTWILRMVAMSIDVLSDGSRESKSTEVASEQW
jgi:hypothetical protein